MDYTNLLKNEAGKKSRVGILGATRGYGYTLLAQIPKVRNMELRIVCSRNTNECRAVLQEVGYGANQIIVCENMEQIKRAPNDAILIASDYHLMMSSGITALVECTGDVTVGSDAATLALPKGINVYMVSKETDSVCGPILNQTAQQCGAVYSLVNGDQPRNLIDLWSWASLLGLEIVSAGKSSEYDFVWDRETGSLDYPGCSCPAKNLPEMLKYWYYQNRETLRGRQELLKDYLSVISADLCEMNLVSNITGLIPAEPSLSYPIIKTSELADVFIPEEDGGILKGTGTLGVFHNLRGKDEASFCGGEFVIVRCENAKMWNILKSKGHIVSRHDKYACLYSPYHYMGLETPASILLGDFLKVGTHPECRQVSVLVGIAEKDMFKGTKLIVKGHHHMIEGLKPELLETQFAKGAAPFYLLNGVTLLNDVKAGNSISLADVDLSGSNAYNMYLEGLKL